MQRKSVIDLRNLPQKSKKVREDYDQVLYKWQAEEYFQYDRGVWWYTVMGGIMATLIGIAVYTRNFMMSVTFVLVAVLGYVYSLRKPRLVSFVLTERGIKAERLTYDYSRLKSFWIFLPHGEPAYLSIRQNKVYLPYLSIPLGEENPEVIREHLKRFIPEVEQEEEFTNVLARLLKL